VGVRAPESKGPFWINVYNGIRQARFYGGALPSREMADRASLNGLDLLYRIKVTLK
jgi:hypothetical protein